MHYNEIMNDLVILGNLIKEKRLSLNLRMDDIARQAGITRSTLWSIERGSGNYSVSTLFRIMNLLGLSFSFNKDDFDETRERATRVNTKEDKKINRFVIMCVEQYASFVNKDSSLVYKLLNDKGVINELTNDYEDLHGMSSLYLNDYIDSLVRQ